MGWLERAVLVEAGHRADGLGHEVVDVADEPVGHLELLLAKLFEWHCWQVFSILFRSTSKEAWSRRATWAFCTTSRRPVGWPLGSSTPSPCRMVVRSAVHWGSPSGMGRRTARKPQAVRTSWLPSCMWQVWQVGAAASAGMVLVRFRSLRTPCFDESYISHCGWSKPMWQVLQASGWRASALEKRWRVWQASQEATP